MRNKLVAAAAYVVFALVLIFAVPVMALVRLVTLPFDPQRRIVGRTLRFVAELISRSYPGWRMRLQDVPRVEKGKAFVAVANHESILDVFLVSRAPWEMKWMAKESLFRVPWLGLLFKLAGDIPVDRKDRQSGGRALLRARDYLQGGMPVMLFPEGTRSRDPEGRLLPFKSGAFKLALETGSPILPIAVYGAAGGMPVNSPWIRPTKATARFLPMISVEGLTEADLPELVERVRAQIQAARDELAGVTRSAEAESLQQPAATSGEPAVSRRGKRSRSGELRTDA